MRSFITLCRVYNKIFSALRTMMREGQAELISPELRWNNDPASKAISSLYLSTELQIKASKTLSVGY